MSEDPRIILRRLLDAALASARPARCLPPHLPEPPAGRTVVVGAGKAAATMAQAVEDHWEGPLEGLVVTRYGHRVPTRAIEVVEAAHPVPDAGGREAAARILAMAEGLGADDLALCLVSGGGSALLTLPAPGIALADKQAVTGALLRSGAAIGEINAVRKHLSAIKGGRLGTACHPARLVSLLISDVPGDDPAVIGSGPTVPDPTTFADALAVLRKYGIDEPAAVISHLEQGREETPKEGDPRLAGAQTLIAGDTGDGACRRRRGGARSRLRARHPGRCAGGARRAISLACHAAARPRCHARHRPPFRRRGHGDRDRPKAAAAPMQNMRSHLRSRSTVRPASSPPPAIPTGSTAPRTMPAHWSRPIRSRAAARRGENAAARLSANDAYGFFAALGDLVMTGPTLTNVNDFRAILVSHSG